MKSIVRSVTKLVVDASSGIGIAWICHHSGDRPADGIFGLRPLRTTSGSAPRSTAQRKL
jgi:hypothetical protein